MAKNPNLKRANDTSEYTPQNVMELKKCQDDPIYFMENYLKVVDPIKGAVPFKLFDYQTDMVRSIHENRNIVILASRQLGKCFSRETILQVASKPAGFRKFILRIIDPQAYDALFSVKHDN
jgi:hypothetical protein